jgi:predicted alpha/beta-hydrolase family hydrolase
MPEIIERLKVDDAREVTAISCAAEGSSSGWTFIYAPGASSGVNDPFGEYACRFLAQRGFAAVRFQFPYVEAGQKGPDGPLVLEATWRAAIAIYREEGRKLVIGGRSMGGRIASRVVADGGSVDALALFAYPLHPQRAPDQRRDQHLPSIQAPTLFCSGTRDTFGSPDELRQAAAKAPLSTVHLMEEADHGFSVRKSSGRTRQDVYDEAIGALLTWLKGLES